MHRATIDLYTISWCRLWWGRSCARLGQKHVKICRNADRTVATLQASGGGGDPGSSLVSSPLLARTHECQAQATVLLLLLPLPQIASHLAPAIPGPIHRFLTLVSDAFRRLVSHTCFRRFVDMFQMHFRPLFQDR